MGSMLAWDDKSTCVRKPNFFENLGEEPGFLVVLAGKQTFDVGAVVDGLTPHKKITVTATAEGGTKKSFTATLRLDTPNEVDHYRRGRILQFALRQMTAEGNLSFDIS